MTTKNKSQVDRMYDLLSDGEAHRTDEIMSAVYGADHLGLARVGARIWDVQKKYGVKIIGWHDEENHSLYWYQMDAAPVAHEPAIRIEEIPEYAKYNGSPSPVQATLI